MGALRISLLGVFRVCHGSRPMDARICRTAGNLLAYLTLFRNRILTRDILAGLFWGEHSEKRARSCLSTAIWRMRKFLEPEGVPKGTYIITKANGEIAFNQKSDHWLDIAEFDKLTSPILAKPYQKITINEAHMLEKALNLYCGDLLEGLYDDWALIERERYRALCLRTRAHLLGYYRNNKAFELALACGRNILAIDPLREEIHREMMRLFMVTGQRALALRQYESCCRIIKTELGISPMEETEALRNQIVKQNYRYQELAGMNGDIALALRSLRNLQEASQDVARAAQKLGQASISMEQILRKIYINSAIEKS